MAGDDADLDGLARFRDRKPFLGEVAKVEIDRLASLLDGVLDRTTGGRATENVRHDHTVEVRVLRLFDLDAEAEPARAVGSFTS
jgi:hypothetical protein